MPDLLKSALLVVLVVLLGLAGYRLIFGAEDDADALFIRSVAGGVDAIDRDGRRTPASAGQSLKPMERVETRGDGHAVLAFGEANTVSLQHGTTIKVLSVSSEGVRLEMDGGRVEATVRPGRGSLDIVSRNREVVAENAVFMVGVNSEGTLAAEAREGNLRIYGVEALNELAEGQRIVAPVEAPGVLAPISRSLLLEVMWPQESRTREAEVSVRGRTDPGAMVSVRASDVLTTVVADAEGRFEAAVPLQQGPNPLEILSEDPLGRQAREEKELTRDNEPPRGARFKVKY
jgi:hypothetical protein